MKRRNIERKLKEVIKAYVASVNDPELRKLMQKNILVTGGAIANMLIDEPVNDYDIYFKTKEVAIKVAEYYCRVAEKEQIAKMYTLHSGIEDVQKIMKMDIKSLLKIVNKEIEDFDEEESEYDKLTYDVPIEQFRCLSGNGIPKNFDDYPISWRILHNIYNTFTKDESRVKIYSFGSWGTEGIKADADKIDSQEIEDEEEGKYEVKFISANAITLSDKIQLVTRFFGDADEIHKNFDFVHATGVWDSETGKLTTSTEQLEALINRALIYKGSLYPLASIFRARKFIYRGWTIDAGQYLKMAFQLNKLDLLDPYTLEEQLTGVDLLYFYQIISDLNYKMMKDENFKPSTEYFIKIIERVFE